MTSPDPVYSDTTVDTTVYDDGTWNTPITTD